MDSVSLKSNSSDPKPNHSLIGLICLWTGALLGILLFCEKLGGLPFAMPSSWYTNSSMWAFLALILTGSGIKIMNNSKPVIKVWRPTQKYPRFESIVFYSRENCELCDEAEELLANYHEYIPIPEIIYLDDNTLLEEKFGNCVPVIEIDGKVRFRGKIDETLLRRLIENAPISQLPIVE